MAINRNLLEGALKNNVVEIKWVRRIPKADHAITRRALATNCRLLLNTLPGKRILNFEPPVKPNPLDTKRLNLVTYYDLFRQDYRNISCESAVLVRIISVGNADQLAKWWKTFDIFIRSMDQVRRKQFIDS